MQALSPSVESAQIVSRYERRHDIPLQDEDVVSEAKSEFNLSASRPFWALKLVSEVADTDVDATVVGVGLMTVLETGSEELIL